MVVLVITRDGRVVDTAELCWSFRAQKRILPGRKPDKERSGEAMWHIAPENRRKMGRHVVRSLEIENRDKEHNVEELYGFFGIVGVGKRWVDDVDVDWWMLRTNKTSVEIGATD